MKKYRLNAGVVVFNSTGKVLLCERIKGEAGNSWQFPQGGIEPGENASEAALRELAEETSVTSVKLVTTLENPLIYDFPPEVKASNAVRGIFNDGQQQYWSLFYFTGFDSEINLQTAEPEFKNWRWADIHEAYKHVISFKKDVYRQVIAAFTPLIENKINARSRN